LKRSNQGFLFFYFFGITTKVLLDRIFCSLSNKPAYGSISSPSSLSTDSSEDEWVFEGLGVLFFMTTMDVDDFRAVLESCGVDVWTFIETAISVAAADYGAELKSQRDGIVERLYAGATSASASGEQPRCRNCDDVDDLRADNCLNVKVPAEKGGSPGCRCRLRERMARDGSIRWFVRRRAEEDPGNPKTENMKVSICCFQTWRRRNGN
jgi:hypothetical protein